MILKRRWKAEITVFLSLLMISLLAFLAALIESSTVAVSKSYARGEADRAIESVFAEYQQELLEEFDIFAIDATYETGMYSIENITERLNYYGNDDMEWEVTQLQLLSDQNCAAFEEQIVTYMSQKYGATQLENWGVDLDIFEVQREDGEDNTSEFAKSTESIVDDIQEDESTFTIENTVLEGILNLQNNSVLSLVMVDISDISDGEVEASELSSNRNLEDGIDSYSLDDTSDSTSKLLVNEYVLEHYYCATDYLVSNSVLEQLDEGDSSVISSEESGGLQYELEYILEGKDSDQENLASIANQLIVMRMATNYACLLQSPSKQAEVNTMALSLATLVLMPELEPAIAEALLLGWAYGESVVDVRSLLSGNHLELVKSESDWQLGLSGLMTIGSDEDTLVGNDVDGGLDYEDFLHILIYLEDKDTVVIRALDMLEQRLQLTCGLEYFQVDTCVTQLEFINTSSVTGGFTYEFPVTFTYR